MSGKIIALVDGSDYATSVCAHAAWVSRRTGSPVELLHVLGRREGAETADYSGSIALGARTALLEELAALDARRAKLNAQRGRAILEDAQALLISHGVTEPTTRLRHGDIVETIGEVESDAGMIVIGKRGESADFAKGHLGSNLERIVRASHRPVLVAAQAFRPISRIVLAYDGGPSALKAVAYLAENTLIDGLDIQLVTVGNPSAEVLKGLETAGGRLHAVDRQVQTRLLTGQPETALADCLEETNADMLVMGAYGHSRIRRLIVGSTTTTMVQSCKVPVLLMR